MNDKIETGGPAFPGKQKSLLIKAEHIDIASQYDIETNGMTLRDYFAAKAISGILANSDISASAARCNVSTEEFREDTAAAAYAMADAMLKARQA